MSNPEDNDQLQSVQKCLSGNRVAMEPLYEALLSQSFKDSGKGVEFCRQVCADYGFTIKQEASANKNIYVYCSREGLPDSKRNPKPSPQRKRPSKRCDCRWRVVLSETDQGEWKFRRSMNPNASEHNHEMMSPDDMVKTWPAEVNELIIQLARQRMQTHEIRESVKQRFPDISWNERRFYNRLTEERKRIRQRGVLERTQRLLLVSAQLCSLVASNEDWATCVDNELTRMVDNYCQLTRLPPDAMASLVDLQTEKIQTDPDRSYGHRLSLTDADEPPQHPPPKKRKSIKSLEPPKGAQVVAVPSYALYVRSQPFRSASESSCSHGRKHADSPMGAASPQVPPPHALGSGPFFHFGSPTSSSSSSSSSIPFQRHPFHPRNASPPPQHLHSPSEATFLMSQPYVTHHHPPPPPQSHYAVSNIPYTIPASFTPYNISSTSDMALTFDSSTVLTATASIPSTATADSLTTTPTTTTAAAANIVTMLSHPSSSSSPAHRHGSVPGSLGRSSIPNRLDPPHPHDQRHPMLAYYPVRDEALQHRMIMQHEYDQRVQREYVNHLPVSRSNSVVLPSSTSDSQWV
ncbi:hypothetical protein DFQ28_006822 [Apophysomyces sp. BC1034]|nr:hypothetical protein DFQ30_006619 [Apophysomyces sp. BC1015]KAG0176880.1 hypothetical protein DFQ29_005535 [Apophysomyces sp. BC1021]KAG0187141.1 hypothetical protein DFQ28_006822 [Apophysomyces sp. BC1034]